MAQSSADRPRTRGELRGWLLAAAGVGCFFTGVAVTRTRRAHAAPAAPVAQPVDAPPVASVHDAPSTLSIAYSSEIGAWLRGAVAGFERANPGVHVTLQPMGTFDAARAIAQGTLRPTLWIPADSTATTLLDGNTAGVSLVRDDGRWPRPLALTPMVFVVWESRARVLAPHGATLPWQRLATVARSPHGWADLGGDAAWGTLKFGHTDPSRSHAGLETLALVAYGAKGRATPLTVDDARTASFEALFRAVESSDPAGDRGTASSGEFAQTLALQGPGRYDAAMVYESQAIASLDVARARWGESLRVYYPPVNVWSDHPLCLVDSPSLTDATRALAQRLADHLRDREAQSDAVRHGLRPADETVALATDDPQNPFVKFRAQGVSVALSQVGDPPSDAARDALLAAWRRVTHRDTH